MNLLARLFRGQWRRLLLATAAGLIAGFCSTGLLAFINESLERHGGAFHGVAYAFAGLCVVVFLSGSLADALLVQMGQERISHLRLELCRRILSAPLRQLQIIGKHRLLAVLTEDVGTIGRAYDVIPSLCIDGAIVLGCFCYLGWLNWRVLALVLVCICVGAVTFRFLESRALHHLKQARNWDDKLYEHYRGLTEGGKELKMHRLRRRMFMRDELQATSDQIRRHITVGSLIYILAIRWGTMLSYLTIGTVLFVVPEVQLLPRNTLTGYSLTILYMIGPLGELMTNVPAIGRGLISWRKIEELGLSLEKETKEKAATDVHIPTSEPQRVELVGVTHRYYQERDNRYFMLGPIDLVLYPGEITFLTGGNGSGKTTLAMVLLGLYVPEHGEVRLNGEPISDVNREHYRQHFAAVFADAYLFESVLASDDPSIDARARMLLGKVQLEHKVRIDGGRFSTTELSQGQRKRLILLSAYLDDRPCYLFDEWAADQDPVFKQMFYSELLPELKARGRTIVVITHDDQYFHLADRRVKLEFGRIVEEERPVRCDSVKSVR